MLAPILARATRDAERRHRIGQASTLAARAVIDRRAQVWGALRRAPGELPRIIAEVKFRSPSAGEIRLRRAGAVATVARAYERGGAAAVSVLADGPSFGGSVLDVRRAVAAVQVPVLFKGFVMDEVHVDLARACGASLVLLLVRAISPDALVRLTRYACERGIEPIVEASSELEVERALGTGASVVGVNARDLATFEVAPRRALDLLAAIPDGRIAVAMSGIRGRADVVRAAAGRADALLVGEALMRSSEPARTLSEWLEP
jgi:indole-3-glycerol phosphate synthase